MVENGNIMILSWLLLNMKSSIVSHAYVVERGNQFIIGYRNDTYATLLEIPTRFV